MSSEVSTNHLVYNVDSGSRMAVTLSNLNNKVVPDSIKITFGSEAARFTCVREEEVLVDVKITYRELFLTLCAFDVSEEFRKIISRPGDINHYLSSLAAKDKLKREMMPPAAYRYAPSEGDIF